MGKTNKRSETRVFVDNMTHLCLVCVGYAKKNVSDTFRDHIKWEYS